MGGEESVISKDMHRNKAQELLAYYDQKYIQKWVLHDEAGGEHLLDRELTM